MAPEKQNYWRLWTAQGHWAQSQRRGDAQDKAPSRDGASEAVPVSRQHPWRRMPFHFRSRTGGAATTAGDGYGSWSGKYLDVGARRARKEQQQQVMAGLQER
jgi:hypothetical protein